MDSSVVQWHNLWMLVLAVCVSVAASLECYSCSHDDEGPGPVIDPVCQRGVFPPAEDYLMDDCSMCSVTTYDGSKSIVRGCEVNSGGLEGLELGCNDIDFFGTMVHVCLCEADACNDASFNVISAAASTSQAPRLYVTGSVMFAAAAWSLVYIMLMWA